MARSGGTRRRSALARRQSLGQLGERLRELEALSAERVADLRRPGQVLLRLTRDGFGVLLPDA